MNAKTKNNEREFSYTRQITGNEHQIP